MGCHEKGVMQAWPISWLGVPRTAVVVAGCASPVSIVLPGRWHAWHFLSWFMTKIWFMSWWNKVWILRASYSQNCGWWCYPSKCLGLRKGERTGYCKFYCEFVYPFQVLCCNFLPSLNSRMSPVSLHRELWKFGTAKPWKVYLLLMKYSF